MGPDNLQLTNAIPWLAVFATWPQAHEQHDAAEFCAHFLRHAKPPPLCGEWHARIAQGTAVRVVDTGTTLLPLKLDRLEPTLQSCLDVWEGQAQIHAMSYFGGALIVQLHRFTHDEADGINKLDMRVEIKPGQEVAIPVFSNPGSTITAMINCRVAFVVYHLGTTQHTGHYQTALSVPSRCVGFTSGWKFMICNDSAKPRLASASDIQAIACNGYLVGLCRIQDT